MTITVISKIKLKPNCFSEAKRQWLISPSNMKRNEPNLLKWNIVRSSDGPLLFCFIEEFEDQAAIEFHIQQDYVKAGVENFAPLIDGEMASSPEELRTWSDITENIVSMSDMEIQ